jgi:hypothetical protein
VKIIRIVAAFALALAACAAPPYGGGIPIDHEKLAARMRLACSFVATAPVAACANGEMDPVAEQGFDETEDSDALRDAGSEGAADLRDAATDQTSCSPSP